MTTIEPHPSVCGVDKSESAIEAFLTEVESLIAARYRITNMLDMAKFVTKGVRAGFDFSVQACNQISDSYPSGSKGNAAQNCRNDILWDIEMLEDGIDHEVSPKSIEARLTKCGIDISPLVNGSGYSDPSLIRQVARLAINLALEKAAASCEAHSTGGGQEMAAQCRNKILSEVVL